MTAGLDGHLEPVRTAARARVVTHVEKRVRAQLDRLPSRMLLVAVDGVDGAGKSTFADELAEALTANEVDAVRASIDSFHQPRAVRWARGRGSPEGFYRDSHDLTRLRRVLIDPVRRGERFCTAIFDEPTDAPVDFHWHDSQPHCVLLFDGIFLHRPELAGVWDLSIWLDGAERVSAERASRVIENYPTDFGLKLLHLARWWARIERYVIGQRIYVDRVCPRSLADIVIDNNDLSHPDILIERPWPIVPPALPSNW